MNECQKFFEEHYEEDILIKKYAECYGVDYNLIRAIAYQESRGNHNIKDGSAIGIMQIEHVHFNSRETSGLFKHLFEPLKNIKFSIITFLIVFISIISSFFGEVGYVFLIPIVAIMYKYINKNPLIGIITVFIGITLE